MNAPDITLVNGRPVQSISLLDRGLHFGDGLFETIACRRGRPRFLALHLDRLLQGCERLRIPLKGVETIRTEVEQLAHRKDAAIIKLIVTRGDAVARGYGSTGDERARRIVLRYAMPIEASGLGQAGVSAGIASMRLGENPMLAGLKHLNRLEQVLAQNERDSRQLRELLLLSRSGLLICGTTTNVFLVSEGTLQTPKLDRCGVAGVMRRVVLREARRIGIPIEERELTLADLDNAQEIFLTNARIGIWPVNALEARELAVGPITQTVQATIEPMLEEPVDA